MGISLLMLVIAGVPLWQYYQSYREERALHDRLQQIRQEIGQEGETVQEIPTQLSDVEAGTVLSAPLSPKEQSALLRQTMAEINPDYVGWLEIKDTTISYPVVFRDNTYYINHDFEGKANSHGAIFLDETWSKESKVWLIHGHHMKDGTMFAGLAEYKDKEYLSKHRAISFDVGEGVENYQIYAAALIDFSQETELAPAFHYEKLPESEETMEQWQNNLKKNAYWYDENIISARMQEPVVVLSTCEYGTDLQRLILVAVKCTR